MRIVSFNNMLATAYDENVLNLLCYVLFQIISTSPMPSLHGITIVNILNRERKTLAHTCTNYPKEMSCIHSLLLMHVLNQDLEDLLTLLEC